MRSGESAWISHRRGDGYARSGIRGCFSLARMAAPRGANRCFRARCGSFTFIPAKLCAVRCHCTRSQCPSREGIREGEPLAAPPDHALRAQLSAALGLVGVRLQDYYIVGQSCECILLSQLEELTCASDGFPAHPLAVRPRSAQPSAAAARRPQLAQQLALDLSYPSADRMPEDWPAPSRPEPRVARSRSGAPATAQSGFWPFLQ